MPEVTTLLVADESLRTAMTFALETEGFIVAAYAEIAAMLAKRNQSATCIIIDMEPDGPDPIDQLVLLRQAGIADPAIILASDPRNVLRGRIEPTDVILIEKPVLTDVLALSIQRIAANV